ncbi:hypothetical protein FCM35_KLT15403 [Carex littledalei]|uniref:Uncharacterized protein n=1 Tax=Carex littledalei TaxID=544730 RepID=A0A833RE97_9POAL|nr:hypothetical protein FCM35_KLT15403 [Carex littledalei]
MENGRKRPREELGLDVDQNQPQSSRMRTTPSFISVIRGAMLAETIRNICLSMEPIIRRVEKGRDVFKFKPGRLNYTKAQKEIKESADGLLHIEEEEKGEELLIRGPHHSSSSFVREEGLVSYSEVDHFRYQCLLSISDQGDAPGEGDKGNREEATGEELEKMFGF